MTTLIQDLISKMSDDSYRVGEKTTDGFTYESDKTVSWAAYEEARQLSNSDCFNELYDIIDTTEEEYKKAHAYFILGHNAKKTRKI